MNFVKFSTLLCLVAFLFSCKKESEDKKENSNLADNGLPTEVAEYVSDDEVKEIKEMGMSIHYGENPPIIGGLAEENLRKLSSAAISYVANNLVLVESNIPEDYEGMTFSNEYYSFSNQNNEDLTIDVNGSSTFATHEGSGTYITGEGDKFTVWSMVVSTDFLGEESQMMYMYSGKLTAEGFEDFEMSVLSIDSDFDDNGSDGSFIKTGQKRFAIEEDGLAAITDLEEQEDEITWEDLFVKTANGIFISELGLK